MKAFKKTKKAFDSAKFYKENGINAEMQKRLNFFIQYIEVTRGKHRLCDRI